MNDIKQITSEVRNVRVILTLPAPFEDQKRMASLCEENGILTSLIEFMKDNYRQNKGLIAESSWCLCNLTAISNKIMEHCVKSGLCEFLMPLIVESDGEIRDNVTQFFQLPYKWDIVYLDTCEYLRRVSWSEGFSLSQRFLEKLEEAHDRLQGRDLNVTNYNLAPL